MASNPTAPVAPTAIVPTLTSTLIPTSLNTFTRTNTAVSTATETHTIVLSATITQTISPSATFTYTGTDTSTPEPSPTMTASLTHTDTGTATYSPTESFTATITLTSTDSVTATWSATPTITMTLSVGHGSAIAAPTMVYGNTSGNTISITYTAGTIGWTTGTLKITMPPGWSAPSLDPAKQGYFTVTCSGGTIDYKAFSGQDMIITISNLPAVTGTVSITYGDRIFGGAGADTAGSGTYDIAVEVDEDGTTTVPIQFNPQILVIPATLTPTLTATIIIGEGSITLTPDTVTSGSTGNVLVFNYTAGSSTWTNGTLRISIPPGWSQPSINPLNAGYVYVTTTGTNWTMSGSGQDIVVSVTGLQAGTGTITVYYGYQGFGGPGAVITGPGIFTLTTRTDAFGTDVYDINNSPQITVLAPTATSTLTPTMTDTPSVTPTVTETLTATDTFTITETWSVTDTSTVTPTITETHTNTATPTVTMTFTVTLTPTAYWTPIGGLGVSDSAADYVSLAIDSNNGNVYAGYMDASISNRGTMMKYGGTAWTPVGSKGFTTGLAYDISAFSFFDQYMAYRDGSDLNRAKVMKYSGSVWTLLTGAPASAAGAYDTTLFYDANYLYLAYRDESVLGKATLKRYHFLVEGSWFNVGTPGFTSGTASDLSLYVKNEVPYVAYVDWANSNKLSVMKYDFIGSQWLQVGLPGFTPASVDFISLQVAGGPVPYVAYTDASVSNKITVKMFDGAVWQTVGAAGFSAGAASYISMFLDGAGQPSAAFSDAGMGGRAVLMKYNGSSWDLFAVLSPGAASYVSASIYGGKPHIAFKDNANGGKLTVVKYEGAY